MAKNTTLYVAWTLFFCWLISSSHALIHKLVIENDERKELKIESFGLGTNGRIYLSFDGFKVIYSFVEAIRRSWTRTF